MDINISHIVHIQAEAIKCTVVIVFNDSQSRLVQLICIVVIYVS